MARVLVARQPWGTLWEKAADRKLSVPASGTGASINTTVYSAATGTGTVASFVTDTNGDLPGWVNEGTHTLTVNGVATQVEAVSAKLLNRLPVNVKASPYNAVGDGVADDHAALTDAIAAVPTGGELFIPKGQYRITQTLKFDKQMTVRGEGLASCIWVDVGTAADGVVFNSPTGNVPLIRGVVAKNFSILGPTERCRNGLLIRNLGNSHFEDVYVRVGTTATGWGVVISGCQVCDFNIICSANITNPYPGWGYTHNGIKVIHEDWPSNANRIDCQVEGATGTGLLCDNATVGSVAGQQNHWITGTYEGITGPGIHMVNGCIDWSIRDCHLETVAATTATENALRIEGCGRGDIGPGMFVFAPTQIVNSEDVSLDGIAGDGVTIDSACRRIRVGRVSYRLNGGTFTDDAPDTAYDGRVVRIGAENAGKAGRAPHDPHNLLANGSLQHWANAAPLGDPVVVAGTITQTGSGQADTRKLGGDYAALMAGLNAELQARVSANTLERLINQWVTSSAWIYIPSGQGTTPQVQIRQVLNSGATVNAGEQSSIVGKWHQITIASLIPAGTTVLDLRLRNNAAAGGNFYVADLAMVAGRVGPHHQAARVSPRRSVSIAYDPPSLADGAAAYTAAITLRGAKVGDPVLVGFSGTQVGMIWTGVVTAADTVRVTVLNKTGGVFDEVAGTLRVEVLPL